MEQSKEYHINNSTIKIIFGNILDSQAEVIVNSSGSKMTMGGGLTRAIREVGGEVIREDAQTKLPVNVSDAVVTTAGRLRQKYVFHCITIRVMTTQTLQMVFRRMTYISISSDIPLINASICCKQWS
jgi:O-acetyl-ADP-ribose deacetylase (regulator of RNase III)